MSKAEFVVDAIGVGIVAFLVWWWAVATGASPGPAAPGVLIYQCRLCHRTDDSAWRESFPSELNARIEAARLVKVHRCGDGRFGVADLVGGRPEEMPREAFQR